jgi:putative membrane protein
LGQSFRGGINLGKKSFMLELSAIFTNRKLLIPIIAILFIPILYSGMFLWAFWDPYKQLDDLPVAVVNADEGAVMDGKNIEIGNDFVEKLKDSKQFDFKFIDKEKGFDELKNQKYYLLIEIPKSFSKNATTLLDEHPKKLEIKYIPNESFNFLSAQIGDTAMQKIKALVSEKVTQTYAETMFDSMTKMADGYQTADEGAGKLNNGINKVNDGAKTLEDKLALLAEKQLDFKSGTSKVYNGSAELAKGSEQLADGLGKLVDAKTQLLDGAEKARTGSQSLDDGIKQVHQGAATADEKMGQVVNGTAQINNGAVELNGYLTQLHSGTEQLAKGTAAGAEEVKASISQLQTQLEPMLKSMPAEQKKALIDNLNKFVAQSEALQKQSELLNEKTGQIAAGSEELQKNIATLNEGQKALKNGLDQLNEGAGKLENGSGQLVNGQTQFTDGLKTFGKKLTEASSGAQSLAGGAGELSSGAGQLELGSKALADGSSQLSKGSGQIADGTNELAAGSKEFKDKIDDAVKQTSGLKADNETYNQVSQPVKVAKERLNKVPNYGTGFAPYFISLGFFVGALLLSIVFPLREPVGVPKNGFSWFAGKFGIITGVGIIQALILSVILLLGLGIKVQSVPLFILFSVITSLVFMALIQLLVTTLGEPGRFLAIIVLILQLTTSAGTFPLELIPEKLQFFNAIFPMTYSVSGFKEVISSGNFAFMWHNGFILFGFMAVFMLLTLLFFITSHKRRYSGMNAEAK